MVLRTVNQEITKPQLIRNSHDVPSKFFVEGLPERYGSRCHKSRS